MMGMPGGNSSGAAAGSLDEKLAQVDELTTKLEAAEEKITQMVSAAMPKVQIRLPRLSPGAFGGTTARQDPSDASGYVFSRLSLLNCESVHAMLPNLLPRGEPPASVAAAAMAASKAPAVQSAAEGKAAQVAAKAAAAERAAQEAAGEMQEQTAKLAAEAQERAKKRFLAPALAAITSLAVPLALASTGIDPFQGAVIAGQAAAALNLVGLAVVWKGRAEMIFGVLSSVFGKVKTKVVDVLDTVDDMILGPLQRLEGAIDNMKEEQQPAIEQMQQLESTLKNVDPDFDIPDPDDLKKPLGGCEEMIDDFVEKAKQEVPEKLDELADATFVGKIATDEVLFNRIAVLLPLAGLFLLNGSVALLQVILTAQRAASDLEGDSSFHEAATLPGTAAAAHSLSARRLRGSASGAASLPGEVDLWPFLQPAVTQIALNLLQQLTLLSLSQGPRVCNAVNGAISSLEGQVNKRVNMRIQGAVDQVFGAAFGEVKGQTAIFFPKFKSALGQLKEALKLAGQAEAAMQAASGAAGMLKRFF
jgi:hypothetical protein